MGTLLWVQSRRELTTASEAGCTVTTVARIQWQKILSTILLQFKVIFYLVTSGKFYIGNLIYMKLSTIAFLSAVTMTTGCSITHPVAADYDKYLANSKGESKFEVVKAADQYFLPAATQNHHYEFRSALAGYAHVWVMEFGKVLDATMQSKDVVDAMGNLTKISAEAPGTGNTVIFDLEKYIFEDFGAHVELTITVKNANGGTFKKTYTADGKTQGGKIFFGGPFGMKNAIQQSTKLATDTIIASFIRDLKASRVAASGK